MLDNRWVPAADELAVYFGVRELSGIFTKTLRDDSLGGLARLQATTSLRQLERRQERLRERLRLMVQPDAGRRGRDQAAARDRGEATRRGRVGALGRVCRGRK